MRELPRLFPEVAIVEVSTALESVRLRVGQLTLGMRLGAAAALATSLLVLAGAIAAREGVRRQEAMTLMVLGAGRRWLLRLYAVEFGLLAGAVLCIGSLVGAGGALLALVFAIPIETGPAWQDAWPASIGAACMIVAAGLWSVRRTLGRRPISVLREG